MKDKLEELLKKAKPLSPEAAKAKATSLKEMMDMLKDGMGKDIAGLKKVTVASNSPEGLKEGLEKAKDILNKKEIENPEEESLESPEEEKSEMSEEAKIAKLEKELEELKAKKKGTELASAKDSIKNIF